MRVQGGSYRLLKAILDEADNMVVVHSLGRQVPVVPGVYVAGAPQVQVGEFFADAFASSNGPFECSQ